VEGKGGKMGKWCDDDDDDPVPHKIFAGWWDTGIDTNIYIQYMQQEERRLLRKYV